MIRHISADFEGEMAEEVEGGAKMEGSILTLDEFDGGACSGNARISRTWSDGV